MEMQKKVPWPPPSGLALFVHPAADEQQSRAVLDHLGHDHRQLVLPYVAFPGREVSILHFSLLPSLFEERESLQQVDERDYGVNNM